MSNELSATPKWLQERKRRWAELKVLAEQFAERAHKVLGKVTVWLYGSVARGDFNFWSDVDVLVVAERLPENLLERQGLLLQLAPEGVEPIGYTLAEFEALWTKRHPNLMALIQEALCLRDDWGLSERIARTETEEVTTRCNKKC